MSWKLKMTDYLFLLNDMCVIVVLYLSIIYK